MQEEAVSLNKSLAESQDCKSEELSKKHEEEMQQFKNEQAKSAISQESRDKELKALKDELRTLHVSTQMD